MLDYNLWKTVKKQIHGPRHLYHLIMDKAVITLNATLEVNEDKEQPDKSFSWLYKAIDDKIAMKPLQSVKENGMLFYDITFHIKDCFTSLCVFYFFLKMKKKN